MIYTLTLNSSIDKTIYIDEVKVNKLNKVNNVFYSAGGKGVNVSKTIKSLGEESIALGFVGGFNGKYIKDKLDELNIKNDFIEIKENTRENIKLIDKESKLTEINEKGPFVEKEDIELLLNKIEKLIKENDILTISGSAPQGIDTNIYNRIIEIVNNKNAKAILDADNELLKYGLEAKPYMIKPNTVELCKYFGIEETSNIDVLKDKCKKLIDKGITEILLSMGKNGALYINKDNCFKINALNIEVKSTVGAGDAMVAALAVSIEKNKNVEEKIKMAIASASGACLTEGTEPSNINVVEKLMNEVIIESC